MNIIRKMLIAVALLLVLNVRSAAGIPIIQYQSESNYPPYVFIRDNHIEGFDATLSRMILKDEDYYVVHTMDTWDKVYDRLRKGEIDTCGLMAVSDERKKEVLFTKPVVRSSFAVYTRRGMQDITIDDLKNFRVRVGVGRGQYAEELLIKKFGVKNYYTYTTIEEAIDALQKGEIGALFENQEVVNYLLTHRRLNGEIVSPIKNLFPADVAYGVSKYNPELVEYMNIRISELQKSGVYEALYEDYFFTHSPYYIESRRKTLIAYGFGGTAVVLLVIASLALYIKWLKRRILKYNKELYEGHEQMQVVLSGIDDGVVSADNNGVIKYLNKAARRLIGEGADKALDRPLNEVLKIVSEDSGSLYEIPVDRIIQEGITVQFEGNTIISSNDSKHPFTGIASPIRGDDGTTVGIVLVLQDVTEKVLTGEMLRHEKGFSKSIMDSANIFILLWKLDGTMVMFNKYAREATGFSEDEMTGKGWIGTFISSEKIPEVMDTLGTLKKGIIPPAHELAVMTKNERKIHVLWNNSIIFNMEGTPDMAFSMGMDITGRKMMEAKLVEGYEELEAAHEELAATEEELRCQFDELQESQEALRFSEERYRLAVDGSNDGIWEYDARNNHTFYSQRCKEILGYGDDEIQNDIYLVNSLLHPDDVERYERAVKGHIHGENRSYRQEFRLRTKGGQYKWVLAKGKAIIDGDGRLMQIAGSISDIDDHKRAEETIHTMAYYDSLTSLPNRTSLYERLSCEVESARRKGDMIALLFMDLDNFKSINDTLGHDFGDRLLIKVSEVLRESMKEGDMLARQAGDEFVFVLTPIKDVEDVKAAAERILKSFEKTFMVGGHEIYITASIGAAVYPLDGPDEKALLRNADTAMYIAKELGKNNYQLYTHEMNERIVNRLKMENSLRYAIKHQEFTVFYQPIINIITGGITSMEALVRWVRPNQGYVSPMEFIPLAEETGLIIPIGEMVLRSACAQNKAWQKLGYPPVKVSVNLSARQFQQYNIVDTVREVLDETGLDAKWLALEITESAALLDIGFTIEVIEKLKGMGVEVSLDDFGTGYSSLNYLKRIPINTLKIDKSFVNDMTMDSNGQMIVKAIILLAHSMNLTVVAEGVETSEQFKFLQEKSCDWAQGYLFSKPLPAAEFEDMLKRGRVV